VDADSPRAERAAELIGANPFTLVLILAAVTAFLFLALVVGVRWAERRGIAWRSAIVRWQRLRETPRMKRLEERWPALRAVTSVEYVVLHAAIGFAVSCGTLVFLLLARGVRGPSAIATFDDTLARSLHAGASPGLTRVLSTFTNFGSGPALTAIGVVVAIALLASRRAMLALSWTIATAGAGALDVFLKAVFQRARPAFADPIVQASGWSFPSGHALGTFVVTGMLVYLASRRVRGASKRLPLVFAWMAWTIAMGFSRIYLGVHYASDVLAGYSAGAVWLAVSISATEVATIRWPTQRLTRVEAERRQTR
jgi:undecaprenyl-diphosphatase